MRLDSVRELKRSLPAQLSKTFAVRRAAGETASLAGQLRGVARPQNPEATSWGSRRGGKKHYRLAVRLQDRALEKSELVARISARAKGEVDVRYVGRIRARAKPWYRSRQRPLAHRLVHRSTHRFLATGFIDGRHARVLRPVRLVERAVLHLMSGYCSMNRLALASTTWVSNDQSGGREPVGGPPRAGTESSSPSRRWCWRGSVGARASWCPFPFRRGQPLTAPDSP